MVHLLRQPVVILLLLAQVLFGSSAGGLICLGGGECDVAAVAVDEHVCAHHEHHSPVPQPAPPHDEDCACVDVTLPIARSDASRAGDNLPRTVAVQVVAALDVCILPSSAFPMERRALTAGAPPPPGLRTTRLLI